MAEHSRLILAIDVYSSERAIALASAAEDRVRAIKVNWPLVMSNGPSIIRKLSRYADILCDFKLADIPQTNRLITEKARDCGAWGIISHIFTGRDSLNAVKEVAGDMKVLGVVAMTHPGSHDFMRENLDRMMVIARGAGIYGVIAPGNDYDLTREIQEKSGRLKVVTPGVGVQGGSASEAINSGADYIIVGRRITQSSSPSDTIDELNDEIRRGGQLK